MRNNSIKLLQKQWLRKQVKKGLCLEYSGSNDFAQDFKVLEQFKTSVSGLIQKKWEQKEKVGQKRDDVKDIKTAS